MTQNPTVPSRPRRRILWALTASLTLAVLAIVALPWALSSTAGRDWLMTRANRALAPGRLRVDSLRFSWFGPTRLTGFVLVSGGGERVAAATTATWDRNLFQVLFERPKLGTLRLDRAEVNVERAPDGRIDLYETLRPVIGLSPRTSARIEVRDGRLRVRGDGFAEPVVAEHAEVVLEIVPTPGPVDWHVRLIKGDVGAARTALTVDGRLDRKTAPGDLEIRVSGSDWPLALAGSRGDLSGRFEGTLSAGRKSGRWTLAGDAALVRAEVRAGHKGERLGIDRLGGIWDLDQTAEGWVVRHFELATARAKLKASGTVTAGGKVELDGEADLAGLATTSAMSGDGLRGRWSARGTVAAAEGGFRVDGGIDLVRLTNGSQEGEPVKLRVRASAPADGKRIDLAELGLDSRYVRIDASGRIDDPAGRQLADLGGKVVPNWENINAWLAEHVEPGARVSGRDWTFEGHGALDAAARGRLDGEIGVTLDGADFYGMKVGPVAVAIHARQGKLVLDPIDTTVNDGRLHLEPEITTTVDGSGPALVFGEGTGLSDAAVNDEVSRRVLSFVAPVLDNATRVRGRVSATIDRAVFPIAEKPGGRGPTVEGKVIFQDLEFVPGPLLDGLFALAGREDRPTLKLNDPVSLTIADRRVSQRGLSVPIGNVSKLDLEGWVGFDRTLNLTASVPVLPTMLADRPILGAVASDARIRVPIRGTLQAPEIDREAFQLGMKELGRTLLGRGALEGAAGLLERLARPRDPDAPPPPTAEERRERRQERRAERQIRRGAMPD